MASTIAQSFEAAAARDHTLNERQREVLRLVAGGMTNGAIAAALDMTLDGAKWNVSEILTKLGFASREEATEYYRWRQRPGARLGRWARGLLAAPVAKWVAGGAAAAGVAAGGVVIALALTGSTQERTGPGEPFLLEATYDVRDSAATIGTNIAGSPGTVGDPRVTRSTLTWLYESNQQYRYRIESDSESEGLSAFEVLADGDELVTYSDKTNTYQRGPLPDWPDELLPYPALSIILGPAPVSTIEELIASFNPNNEAGFFGSVVRHEELLGRRVAVIEFRPTSRGSSSSASSSSSSSSSSSEEVETADGIGRVWVDEAEMVVLRFDNESSVASFSAVVTRFERPTKHAAGAFRFVAPAGASEQPRTDSTSPGRVISSGGTGGEFATDPDGNYSGGGTLSVPATAGFLQPGYLPAGFRSVAYETSDEEGQVTAHSVTYASSTPGDSGRITLSESLRAGGLPESAKTGDAIALRGVPAYVSRDGDRVVIRWAERGHVVTLTGVGVAEGELRAVARGLTIAP